MSRLTIVKWPDPRLSRRSDPVRLDDERLNELAEEMIRLMHEAKGVGLAAPQVGLNIRLFVANPNVDECDDRVFINPTLEPLDAGAAEAEEGCLSLPGISVSVLRDRRVRIRAYDLLGNLFEEVGTEFESRVWQHENDHLDGVLLLDRMGPLAKMTSRRTLRDLEEQFTKASLPPARARG